MVACWCDSLCKKKRLVHLSVRCGMGGLWIHAENDNVVSRLLCSVFKNKMILKQFYHVQLDCLAYMGLATFNDCTV